MDANAWRLVRNAAGLNILLFGALIILALSLGDIRANNCTGDPNVCAGLNAGLEKGAQAVADIFVSTFIALAVGAGVLAFVADRRAQRSRLP